MTRSILVVEDDANALSGYLEFLASAGFQPVGVPDGSAALAIALEHPPAAVVTDISLPGLSGFALAEALSQDPRTRDVPLIGLTAHWTTDVSARATKSGMHTVLLKPCVPAHLVAELKRVLAGRKTAQV